MCIVANGQQASGPGSVGGPHRAEREHLPFRDLFHVKNNPCHAYRGGQGQLLKVVRR